jgi:purine-nucleoside phosphorylase
MPTDGLMSDPYALAKVAGAAILERFDIPQLDLALVLGSGWSAAADDLGDPIGSCEIAAIFTGRTHIYEGYGVDQVVHGVRSALAAGATVLVLTNGCGGLNTEWPPGSAVLIRDYINLTGTSPLLGARFIDMTEPYSRRLRDLARSVEPGLPEGVYVQFRGPQFETPAEVQMAGAIGGDLVGMSTALETIAARELGAEVLGISLVTNLAAGISPLPLSHEEVLEAGREAAPRLRQLLAGITAAL